MIHNKFRYLMTLVALFAMTAGAWAADTYTITFSGFGNEACNKTVTDATLEYSETFNVTDVYANYTMLGGVGGSNDYVSISKSQDEKQITITVKSAFEGTVNVTVYYMNENYDESERNISVTCVKSTPAITVEWNAATNTGTFTQPGSDVVLTPIYAPAAKWATEGDAVLAPTAIEGVIAGTTDAIVKAGTVATGQGTAMYFATTDATMTAEKAATANGWLSTLPTAAGYDDATTVYVWYYIQGADTPDGQEATDKNTFNDSEICAQPLEVSVLSNKFDIAFKAANANTIDATQASKGTVSVKVGTGAAVDMTSAITDEGKLEAIKMGSEVKLKANTGYKFRKVEVKKGGAKAPTTAQLNVPTGWNGDNTNVTANDLPGFVALTDEEAANIPCPDAEGYVYVIHNFVGDGYIRIIAFYNGERQGQQSYTLARYHDEIYYDVNDNQIKYYYTTGK